MIENLSPLNFSIVYLSIGLFCGFVVFLYQILVKKRWIKQYKESLELYLKDPSGKDQFTQFLHENPPSKNSKTLEEYSLITCFWPVFLLIGVLLTGIWLGDVIKDLYHKFFSFDKQIYKATMELKQQNLAFIATHPDSAIRDIAELDEKDFDGKNFAETILYKDENEKLEAQLAHVRNTVQKMYGGKVARSSPGKAK